MPTLYRKYRPQNWKEIVGQNHIKLTLQKELETNKLAHAYLFAGPRGVGKTTTARILSKALNCEKRADGASEPCNECTSCQETTAGRSIDVLEIDAASNTGVDHVRENIIDSARFVPTKSKYKIFIIDEVHMLSTAAFNALLKTLEEPPAHIFFILATTETHKLPATIVSRCQRFDFKKVPAEKIRNHLELIAGQEGVELERPVLDQITHLSEGCLRDAESLLEQVLSLNEEKITVESAALVLPRSDFHLAVKLLEFLGSNNLKEAIGLLNNLVEEGLDLIHFSDDLIQVLHHLVLAKAGPETTENFKLEEELNKKINKLAKEIPLPRLTRWVEVFLKQRNLLRSSPIPQLPLEMALVELSNEDVTVQNIPRKDPPTPPTAKIANNTTPTSEPAPTAPQIDKIAILKHDNGTKTAIKTVELIEIKQKWSAFIKKVQDYNHSLPFILKMGEPAEINGKTVRVAFKYTFHRDKLNEAKMRQLAEKAMDDVFPGAKLAMEGFFTPLETSHLTGNDGLVSELLNEFGGTVVS